MITINQNELEVVFPAVSTTPLRRRGVPHGSTGELFERPMKDSPPPKLTISFERTLRVPCDSGEYPLPPSLGGFPLRHVDDYPNTVPQAWRDRGGILLPMYQSEALWINFSRDNWAFAVQVGAGKVNAVSGEPWSDELQADPQGYCVVPGQPWLDGFKVSEGAVRQFVAAPLGQGHTVEEQVAGTDDVGGIQLAVSPMTARAYWESDLGKSQLARLLARSEPPDYGVLDAPDVRFTCFAPESQAARDIPNTQMGLAAGGSIRQEVTRDKYGLASWDQRLRSRCFVHIVNSAEWRRITGEPPPHKPVGVREYNDAGLPWFEYYDDSAVPVPGSEQLAKVKPYGG